MKSFVLLILLASSTAWAQLPEFDELKVQGKTYKSVKVTKVTADAISITHASGIARILIKKLPKNLKEQFDYDYATAENTRKERERIESAREKHRITHVKDANQKAQQARERENALEANKKRFDKQFRIIRESNKVYIKTKATRAIEYGSYRGVIIYSSKVGGFVALFGAGHTTNINCYASRAAGNYNERYPIYIKVAPPSDHPLKTGGLKTNSL